MDDQNHGRFLLVNHVLFERDENNQLSPFQGKTDWARLAAMTEEEIEANALSDPDSLPFTDEEWERAKIVRPRKVSITIRLDEDILDYFQKKHGKYQTGINAALRKAMSE